MKLGIARAKPITLFLAFIFVLLILMAYVWIFLLSGRFDGAPKEDVWRAMQTCPTKYTIELKDDGSFKGCVLTERLGERN